MSTVRQCDRCKALPNEAMVDGGVGRITFPKKIGVIISHWAHREIDLCTRCLSEFLEYIKPIK